MTADRARLEVVRFWLEKADTALEAARAEHAAGRYDFAVNRAYYAAFYGASAVLLLHGESFVRHSGLRAAVHRALVKPGLIETDLGRTFDRLFESRQQADYLAMVRLEANESRDAIGMADRFVEAMKSLASDTSS